MSATRRRDPTAWYRQPMVWLVIAIPASSVVMGAIMLSLAIVSYDGLVVDDYYKRGLEINQSIARDRAAIDLGVEASLRLAAPSGGVQLEVRGNREFRRPPALDVNFLHATRAGRDVHLTLHRSVDGRYLGPAVDLQSGRWYVQVEAEDWRLTGVAWSPSAAGEIVLRHHGESAR